MALGGRFCGLKKVVDYMIDDIDRFEFTRGSNENTYGRPGSVIVETARPWSRFVIAAKMT